MNGSKRSWSTSSPMREATQFKTRRYRSLTLRLRDSRRNRPHLNFMQKSIPEPILFDFEIESCLQVQAEPFRHAEVSGQPKRCIGRDAAQSKNDLVDSTRRHTKRFSQAILAEAKRNEELFLEYVPGVNRLKFAAWHCTIPFLPDQTRSWLRASGGHASAAVGRSPSRQSRPPSSAFATR